MTKEALKLALEALEAVLDDAPKVLDASIAGGLYEVVQCRDAITAIKEALAHPEQCQCPNCKVTLHASDCAVHNEPAYPKGQCNCGAQPEQEPVAYLCENAAGHRYFRWKKPTSLYKPIPLYARTA